MNRKKKKEEKKKRKRRKRRRKKEENRVSEEEEHYKGTNQHSFVEKETSKQKFVAKLGKFDQTNWREGDLNHHHYFLFACFALVVTALLC